MLEVAKQRLNSHVPGVVVVVDCLHWLEVSLDDLAGPFQCCDAVILILHWTAACCPITVRQKEKQALCNVLESHQSDKNPSV